MSVVSRLEAQEAVDLAKLILARAESGLDTPVPAANAEIVAFALLLMVRLSEHAPHYPEARGDLG